MKPTQSDLVWLGRTQPDLTYDPKLNRIDGELSFCASYDKANGYLRIEELGRDEMIREQCNFISDCYEIAIELDKETAPWARFPEVREIGGRKEKIVERLSIGPEDLHFYTGTNVCCLTISYAADPTLTVKRFVKEFVVPFFYRLSFVDRFGLGPAKRELWDDYSHGDQGMMEHNFAMTKIADCKPKVNDRCPCGTGMKFKKCCRREFHAWRRSNHHSSGIRPTPVSS